MCERLQSPLRETSAWNVCEKDTLRRKNVNKILGNASKYSTEKEIAVPLNIPTSEIKSVKKVKGN